jgi:hypothetical protein
MEKLNQTFLLNKNHKAGFEFEYANVKLPIAATAIQKLFGGEIEMINPYHYKLHSKIGTFKLMIDFSFLVHSSLKKVVKEYGLDSILPIEFISEIENLIANIGENLIPYEITTPPLVFNDIALSQKIVETLRDLGAYGTNKSLLYAFGMHINIEEKNLKIDTILQKFRAYLILYEFINNWLKPDLSRRISPYIKHFDSDFIIKVLNLNYNPSLDKFISDYIAFNPTRNRSLDLLPLLAFLNEKKVKDALPNEKINKRPTYHYRLPDSKIDETSWCCCEGWNSWVLVELLANDNKNFEKLAIRALDFYNNPINLLYKDEFIKDLKEWVKCVL